jgi:hypothetical protein
MLYLFNIPITQPAIEGAKFMDVPYLTKEHFIQLNDRAIRRKANRTLKRKFLDALDDSFKYPIIHTMLHNDVEMRCQIAYSAMGETCWLDISLADFDVLPTVEAGHNA